MAITMSQLSRFLNQSNKLQMGEQISLTFNSMVNVMGGFQIDPKKTPLSIAVKAFQANCYINIYEVPETAQTSIQSVLEWCQENGHIGLDEYPFPAVKGEKFHSGQLFKFSDPQIEFIQSEEQRGQLDFLESGVRAGKTTAVAFRQSIRYANHHRGQKHAIGGWTYSTIKRLALDSVAGLTNILPMAEISKKDGESLKLVMNSLLYPFTPVEVYLFSLNNKRSESVVKGLSLDSVWLEEVSELNSDALIELNNRQIASSNKYTVATTNPLAVGSGLLRWIRMFNGNEKDTESSNHLFKMWKFSLESNPALNAQTIQEIKEQYSHDSYLYSTKILGMRAKRTGTVVYKFDEKTHVVRELPKPQEMGKFIQLTASMDVGFSDGTSVICGMTYFDNWGNQKTIVLGELWHKTDDSTNVPEFDVSGKDSSEYAYATKHFLSLIMLKLRTIYPKKTIRWNGLFIDPSSKSMILQMSRLLDFTGGEAQLNKHLLNLDARKANNNSSDKTKTKGIENHAGIEYGFEQLNRLFSSYSLTVLESPSVFGLDGYGTDNLIQELSDYCRKSNGELITAGDGHGDSVQNMRYFSNAIYDWVLNR